MSHSKGSMETTSLIVGASAAGLATACCLKKEGVPYILLEKTGQVGSTWRHHYDRLHLHTSKKLSTLPYLSFPDNYPKYPSRDQVVEYLEAYAEEFQLEPRFNQDLHGIP
jgi:indole-3-pyruvate monooxygenase